MKTLKKYQTKQKKQTKNKNETKKNKNKNKNKTENVFSLIFAGFYCSYGDISVNPL